MAFTRSWDETQPDGSEAASDIDLEIRKVKEDIRERLEDITTFGTGTDPLELDASAVEAKAPVFYGLYDDNQSAGSKVTSEGRGKLVAINFSGDTDGSGFVTIDVGEFTESLDITVSSILHVAATQASSQGISALSSGVSPGGDTITVECVDDTGSAVASTTVNLAILMVVA